MTRWMAVISIVTFVVYGWDKLQAKRGGWRVKETWLHGLALAGGWAGGWAGMFVFRHKVRKRRFKAILALSTVLWLTVLAWMAI